MIDLFLVLWPTVVSYSSRLYFDWCKDELKDRNILTDLILVCRD
jgi:hypothetical protein